MNKFQTFIKQNNIVNIKTDIQQKNLGCKKISSKIKTKSWINSLICSIIFIIILSNLDPGAFDAFEILFQFISAVVVVVCIYKVIIIPFVNYTKELSSSEYIFEIIRKLNVKDINLKIIHKLGIIKLYTDNSLTDSVKEEKLGYLLMEWDEKSENGKLIILDTTINCNIFAIKEFNFSNLKKFKIFKDLSELDNIHELSKEADIATIKSEIRRDFHSNVRASQKLIELQKAKKAMKRLYILFDDGSEFLITDLDDNTRVVYDKILSL